MLSPSSPLPPTQRTWRVLIADDDRLTRIMLRRTLEQEGCQVLEAQDGELCIQQFLTCAPDLVLLDAMMPKLDGFQCCAQILAQPNTEHVPVLMITGLNDKNSVDRAFDAGATDFITKPIHWAVLRRRVRLLLEKAQLQLELKAANRQLQKLVMTDPLTHLANRRQFDEVLANEWRRASREATPISLVMCDIDSFKPYNDHYGHPQGDRCLQAVAQVFRDNIRRAGDLIARYGGEEFAIILPNTRTEGARHVAERVRRGIMQLNLPHSYSRADSERVTLSLGIATLYSRCDLSTSFLVKLADEALYQAKAAGGNCCRIHQVWSVPEDASESFIQPLPQG